jgi:hypothetical protein
MLLNPGLDRGQRAFRRLTACVDVAVMGIAAERVPSPLQFFIERIQVDVGQQRRQRPALRRALRIGLHYSVHQRAPPLVFPDQMQHPFVPDDLRHPAHQNVVIDVVEEFGDV